MTHRVVAPALAGVLLVAAVLAGGCSGDEYVAPPPAARSEVADPAAAAATVAALQAGLDDPAAAAELGSDDTASDLLAAIARNVSALRLTDVTFAYVTETGTTAGDDAWDGLVGVTWRLAGFDRASARAEVPVSFADGGRTIAAIGADAARLPLWLTGPVAVRRVPGAVVVAAGPAPDVGTLAQRARSAVAATRPLLERGDGLVVEVPADTGQLHRALGADPGTYDAIAAVTAPVDGSTAPLSPVHVFLNRAVYDALDPVAAQVVMTHEAVHAVTGAALTQGAPLWLVEGFADYVALRDVDLPVARTAAQVIRQVRRDGLPDRLPADSDFGPGASHLGTLYEAAWQVAVTLAERRGAGALFAFYRDVLDGEALDVALRTHFDWTEADLTAAWRSRLAVLAGVPE
ncbi:MAG TPA: hypothetical protein VNS46_11890 [Nocardioides sp.]|nr:hypothetical protein [Nocardioides sp.]